MTGTIKTLVSEKGFGFISREGEEKDLFFHNSELVGVTFDELKVGDVVTFEIKPGGEDANGKMRGPSAIGVSRA